MRQDTRVAATTDSRRSVRLLRPLLLLGGFVVVWWCLATGSAQAAEGPQHDLRTTTQALSATADRVVEHTVRHAVDHRTHLAPVKQAVHHQVAPVRSTLVKPVVRTVTAIVATTPVKPVLTKVSQAPSQLHPVATTTRATQSTTPAALVREPAAEAVDPGASSTLPEKTASVTTHPKAPSTTAHHALAASPPTSPPAPRDEAPVFPPSAAAGASVSQTGSGSGPGAAVCETGATLSSPTTKTSIDAPAGRPTAGPAYPPSCSPD